MTRHLGLLLGSLPGLPGLPRRRSLFFGGGRAIRLGRVVVHKPGRANRSHDVCIWLCSEAWRAVAVSYSTVIVLSPSFTLSVTVSNTGDGESPATTLRYYRSTDATITTSDTQESTDAIPELSAAGTSSQSVDLKGPFTPGTYYYGACVDTVTGESDTTNNCSTSVPVTVPEPKPDLVVESPSVDDSGPTAGTTFTLSATVRNDGVELRRLRRCASTGQQTRRSPHPTHR